MSSINIIRGVSTAFPEPEPPKYEHTDLLPLFPPDLPEHPTLGFSYLLHLLNGTYAQRGGRFQPPAFPIQCTLISLVAVTEKTRVYHVRSSEGDVIVKHHLDPVLADNEYVRLTALQRPKPSALFPKVCFLSFSLFLKGQSDCD
jgi:hypothetical protein